MRDTLVLTVTTALVTVVVHRFGSLAWYESAMMGLLIGVLVKVTANQWDRHKQEWNEFLDLFRNRRS